jgi:hypothetical protein
VSEDAVELRVRPQELAARERRLRAERAEGGLPKKGLGTCSWSAVPSD